MIKSKKKAALLLLAFFAVTFLSSLMFIIAESDHHCACKDECGICEQIKNCLNVFNNNSPKPEGVATNINFIFAAVLCIGFAALAKKFNTPVTLKVKLSN